MAVPTYSDLATMVASSAFKDRTAIAVTKFAKYILAEAEGTAGHRRRFNWAFAAVQNPISTAAGLAQAIALDAVFTAQNPLDFAATSDASVQTAVEATVVGTVLSF